MRPSMAARRICVVCDANIRDTCSDCVHVSYQIAVAIRDHAIGLIERNPWSSSGTLDAEDPQVVEEVMTKFDITPSEARAAVAEAQRVLRRRSDEAMVEALLRVEAPRAAAAAAAEAEAAEAAQDAALNASEELREAEEFFVEAEEFFAPAAAEADAPEAEARHILGVEAKRATEGAEAVRIAVEKQSRKEKEATRLEAEHETDVAASTPPQTQLASFSDDAPQEEDAILMEALKRSEVVPAAETARAATAAATEAEAAEAAQDAALDASEKLREAEECATDAEAATAAGVACIAAEAEAARAAAAAAAEAGAAAAAAEARLLLEKRAEEAAEASRIAAAVAVVATRVASTLTEISPSSAAHGGGSSSAPPTAAADEGDWNPGSVPGVYVIECNEPGYFYVGATNDLASRIAGHRRGGSETTAWVRVHGGVRRVLRPIEPANPDLNAWEQAETTNRMLMHGLAFVRGWSFTQTGPLTVDNLVIIRTLILEKHQVCRMCGEKGHFAITCGGRAKAIWLKDIDGLIEELRNREEQLALQRTSSFTRGPSIADLTRGRSPASGGGGSSSGRKRARESTPAQSASRSALGPTCGRCGRTSRGKFGHTAEDCFDRKTSDGKSLPSRCRTCLREGHTARRCNDHCRSCGADISKRPTSHTLCLACWR